MSINEKNLREIENLIDLMGFQYIKKDGIFIYQNKHFCTQNLDLIKETVDKLIKLKLT